MDIKTILIQLLGILGIAASIWSFQCKKHKPLVYLRTACEFFFGIQYFLLGAYTGMAMNIIGCIRNLIFAKTVEKKKSTIPGQIIFSAFFIIFGIVTWAGLKSILVAAAKVLSTVAYGNRNVFFARLLIFLTSSIWLVYNFIVGSYAGCVCESLNLCSIIVGIIRIDIPSIRKSRAES